MRRRDEVAVGMLVTVAVTVLLLGVLWLARGGLTSGYPLYTRFAWGQNLKQGQPVLLAGVTVGYVDDVQLRPEGFLFVLMRVNNEYKVPKGTVSAVRAVGFFGDVAVALTPALGAAGGYFVPGDTVPSGAPAASVDEVVERVDSISATLGQITRAMHAEVVQTGGLRDLRKTIATTADLATQLQHIAAEQSANITKTLDAMQHTAHSLTLDSAAVDSTVRNFRDASANFDRLSERLGQTNDQFSNILARLQRGEGSAGKLLTDTLLYADVRHAVASFDSILTDLKANPKKYLSVKFSIW